MSIDIRKNISTFEIDPSMIKLYLNIYREINGKNGTYEMRFVTNVSSYETERRKT